MGLWMLLAVLVVVLLIAAAAIKILLPETGERRQRVGDAPGEAMPYRLVEGLLTRAEAEFYHVLRRAVEGPGGAGGLVMAKVRLIDLVEVPRGTPKVGAWKQRVVSKHVDFVICDPQGPLRPWLVVELDDRSHERADRRERDDFVDRVLHGAGVRVVRVPLRRGGYEVGEVRRALGGHITAAAPFRMAQTR